MQFIRPLLTKEMPCGHKNVKIERQSNSIEHNRKAIKRNRTQSNFPKFSIFDWHSIDSINQISIVRLRSIVFD